MVPIYVFLALLLLYVVLAVVAPSGSKLSRATFALGNGLVLLGIALN